MKVIKNIKIFILIFLFSCSNKLTINENEKNNPDIILKKGRDYYIAENYKLAIKTFNYILKNFKENDYNSSWAKYEIGMCFYQKKNYKKARKTFTELLNTYSVPNQPRTLAKKLIKKIDSKNAHKNSSYEND